MPRTHSRTQTAIWKDGDFTAMRRSAQAMYLFLLSQDDLTHAGLLPLRVRRWATKAEDTSPKSIRDDLDYLAERDYIVVDEDTEEVLVRTFVRNDGVYKQPLVMERMREDAKQIESPMLRMTFASELGRLPIHELSDEPAKNGGASVKQRVCDVLVALSNDFRDASREGMADPSERVTDTPHAGACTSTNPQPPSPSHQPPSPIDVSDVESSGQPADVTKPAALALVDRADVTRICAHLADRIAEDGSKRPAIGKTWETAARLMLDKDGRSEQEIHAAIDWCQGHHFWRTNILSLPTLREKYDQLRKVAASEQQKRPSRQQQTDDLFARNAARLGITGGGL